MKLKLKWMNREQKEAERTELVFILDRSGSMAGLEADTIGGFNSMLEKQRGLPGECRVTTVLFSNEVVLVHDRADIRKVEPMTRREYQVGGCTALLDAIGDTIRRLVKVQRDAGRDRAEKVMFVIITDGEDNASRHYSAEKVKDMLRREKEKYGWEFVFLGANIDAVETAGRFGIGADRAVNYVPDRAGTALNFQAMSAAVADFRAGRPVSAGHFEAIRKDMAARGKRP